MYYVRFPHENSVYVCSLLSPRHIPSPVSSLWLNYSNNATLVQCNMAWSYRKNARCHNPRKDVVRKAVCNKMKRKTKNEMAGWHVHGPEKDGNKRIERQSKGLRSLEAYCKGGQGPPWAVAPLKKIHNNTHFVFFICNYPPLSPTFQIQCNMSQIQSV
jgi:hypothetical protein